MDNYGSSSLTLSSDADLGNSTSETYVTPQTLRIDDVSLSVTSWNGSWWKCVCCKRGYKRVLKNISLTVQTGEIAAFIGNSGSGKTSLLNVIASRHSGKLEGNVLLDDKKLTHDMFRNKAGYVIQADRFLATLTVRETLEYTARLKFCGRVSQEGIKCMVGRSLRQMSLLHVAETLVGGTILRGISGGERRRLSIAIQILQDPELILLDEPTTGLDSYTSHYLIKTLADLAHKDNKMVVLSIHQPRSDIFRLLDTVGIMCSGEMVYYGPRTELVPYFTDQGYPCPTYANPLDFYIDIASVDRRCDTTEAISGQRVEALCKTYKASDIYVSVNQPSTNKSPSLITSNNFIEASKSNGYIEQSTVSIEPMISTASSEDMVRKRDRCFGCLRGSQLIGINTSRLFLYMWRDRIQFINRLLTMTFVAMLTWVFCGYLDLSMKGIQDRIGVLFQTTAFGSQVAVIVAVPIFPAIRDMYYRESVDGLYNAVHFLLAYYIHLLPLIIVADTLFAVWLYWGIGMYPDPSRFGIFIAVVVIVQTIGELHLIICMGIFYDDNTARALATLLVSVASIYSSGFLKSVDMIKPLEVLTYISFQKYAAEIVAANEFVGLEFQCDLGPNCTYPGEAVLDNLLPDAANNFNRNFAILVSMLVIYWILGIVTYVVKGRKVLH